MLKSKLAPPSYKLRRSFERLEASILSYEKRALEDGAKNRKQLEELAASLKSESARLRSQLEEQRRYSYYLASQLDAMQLAQYQAQPDAGIKPYRKGEQLVVSMTSYPARINSAARTVLAMMRQSVKPDTILLWLSKEQFPHGSGDLPQELLTLERLGLEIRYCSGDLKAHKKYFYAFKECPKDLIVTVDDDINFDSRLLEELLECHKRHPKAVAAARTHVMRFENGVPLPYNKWEHEAGEVDKPSLLLFATTGAGTLYPQGSLPAAAFDEAAIRSLCLDADDIWLKVMELCAGVPTVLARPIRPMSIMPATQGSSLWSSNYVRNDEQLLSVLEKYKPKLDNIV